MDNYDGLTLGDILSEIELQKKNKYIYNNSLKAIPTGSFDNNGNPLFKMIGLNELDANVISPPFELQVSSGKVAGAYFDVKFGTNPSAGITWEVVRQAGGLINYASPDLSIAVNLSISSDSVNDTDGGSGCWAVGVVGLDEDGFLQTEIVRLNGQTPVLTVGLYTRIFRMWNEESAPNTVDNRGGEVDGIVYCGRGTVSGGVPATICITIVNGQNQSQFCALTIPKGKEAYVKSVVATTVKDKEFEFGVFTRDTQKVNSAFRMRGNSSLYRSPFQQEVPWIRIDELTDVEFRCKNLTSGSDLVTSTLVVLYLDKEV